MTLRTRVIVASVIAVLASAGAFALFRSDASPRRSEESREPPEPTPTPPDGPYRFVALGDFGDGGPAEFKIATAIDDWTDSKPINALISTGDNVYESGAPSEFASAWTGPFGWVDDEHVPVVATLGNHDVETAGGAPVMELLGMPAHWYARRIGPVEFVVLDANRPEDPAQLQFLRETIAGSTARWTVAVFHQPVYSCSLHGSTPAIDAIWLPILRHDGVDLVLNGHDHTYERFGPLNGTTFIVTGGGGAALYDESACPHGTPEPDAHEFVHHFVTLQVSGSTMRVDALDADLHRIDHVVLDEPKPAG
jgi:3',5'-cyclic AMP phosphodiesterase CpdA